MTAPIQFTGIASGLDTRAIIDALMAAERLPITRLESRKTVLQQKQTALNDIKSRLANLQLKAADLTLASKVNARRAPPADSTILTATADATAASGVLNVTVKQLAAATVATSTQPLGAAISTTADLEDAGFAIAPTAGTFTINGKVFTITLGTVGPDDATATLTSVKDAIDTGANQTGVTVSGDPGLKASIVNDSAGRPNILRIESTSSSPIQLGASGDTSNFLTVAKLLGATPVTIQNTAPDSPGTATVGMALGASASITAIDVAGAQAGKTYTFSYDAGTNQLTLTRSGDGAFQTITIADLAANAATTYDFSTLGVKVTVTDSGGGETADDIGSTGGTGFLNGKTIITGQRVQSQGNLGTLIPSQPLGLAAARLAPPGAPALAASGTFTVNGKTVTWTAATDSLNSVISRINGSGAGVTASYDALKDALVMTSTSTGATLISLADATGNFLEVVKVATGGPPATTDATAQVVGKNAVISVDGGADFSSSSNTVTGAVVGVTFDVKKTGTTTVTVGPDTDTTVTAVKAFVDQFNSTIDLIRQKTKFDSVKKKGEVLLGDITARQTETTLRTLVTAKFTGSVSGDKFQSLPDVGITTGAVGSAVGTTTLLTVDETKLRNALTSDPNAVEKLFKVFTNSISAVVTGGAISAITGAPTAHHQNGSYTITTTAVDTAPTPDTASLSSVFTPAGGAAQAAVTGTITAGSTNTSFIPGVTLTAGADGALATGSASFTVTVTELGAMHRINDYLKDLTGISGAFKTRDDAAKDQIEDIGEQITMFERRVEQRRRLLERRFTELEKSLAAIQQQQQLMALQLQQLSQQRLR